MIRSRRRIHMATPLLSAAHRGRRAPRKERPGLVIEGRFHRLPADRWLTVGSGPDAQIRVRERHVSHGHCEVRALADGGVEVRDAGSTNGVWVGGRKTQLARLISGEVAMLGRCPLLVVDTGISRRVPEAIRWQTMVSADPRSLECLCQIAAAASVSAPVWIHGESGTGKERAARALHGAGPRREAPFVALNCAALPASLAEAELFGVSKGAYTGAHQTRPGAFERADGGTLLLDEVGDLAPAVQAKLLRVLETGELMPVGGRRPISVDVRVVAATWKDLEAEAASGSFRFDLLQRLWVLRIQLLPLRARVRDIRALLEAFLAEEMLAHRWPDSLLIETLESAQWSGNVRQLRNRVAQAALLGDLNALVPGVPGEGPVRRLPRRGTVSRGAGMAHICRALELTGGNRSAAARELGVSRSTLYRWLRASSVTNTAGAIAP